jgi:hypothetical protein
MIDLRCLASSGFDSGLRFLPQDSQCQFSGPALPLSHFRVEVFIVTVTRQRKQMQKQQKKPDQIAVKSTQNRHTTRFSASWQKSYGVACSIYLKSLPQTSAPATTLSTISAKLAGKVSCYARYF